MQLLLLKLRDLDAKPEYALLGKKQASNLFTPSEWSKVRSSSRGRKVILLLPNSDIVLTSISIPSKNKKQLLQAVPYALEDSLAEDIEDLHFAIHKEETETVTQVAIINHDLLGSYIERLKKEGITAHYVLPQLLAQTSSKGAWSLQREMLSNSDSATTSVRLNDFSGFSCDESLLPIFLDQVSDEKPSHIHSNIEINDLPELLRDLPYEKFERGTVAYKSIIKSLPISLLTGYVNKKQGSSINLLAWRPAIILASLLAVAWLGIFAWQNNILQKEKNQLSQEIETIFKTTFPKSRIVDPAQQMAAKLGQLKKSAVQTVNSPLPLISDIGPLLKEYKDMTLKEVRYQENELVLVMQSPNLTRLESFKKDAIKKSNLQVDIKTSTTTANKVEATLVISPLKLSKIEQEKA